MKVAEAILQIALEKHGSNYLKPFEGMLEPGTSKFKSAMHLPPVSYTSVGPLIGQLWKKLSKESKQAFMALQRREADDHYVRCKNIEYEIRLNPDFNFGDETKSTKWYCFKYRILTSSGEHVAEGDSSILAVNKSQAISRAVAWVVDTHPAYDDRIDPMVKIDECEEMSMDDWKEWQDRNSDLSKKEEDANG